MKKAFCVLLVLLLLFSLTGCHGSKGMDAFVMPDSFDESRTYELTFWAKNDTNKTQTDIYEKAIRDFEAIYPNIRINLRLYTDYVKLYNDVITNIPTNTTPNICITYPDHIATYLTGTNTVVPLDELMADEKLGLGGSEVKFDSVTEEEIVPRFLEECYLNGRCCALPYMRSTEACYVNKTYVEKLGFTLPETLTWDFVWQVSEAAAQQDSEGNYTVNGQKVMLPFIYKSTDNMMIQLLRQSGGGYSQEDGTIEIFNDVTRSHLETVADEVSKGAFSTFKISGYPANYLNAGQCIFAVDSTAGSTWMGSDAPLLDISEDKLVEFETEVMAIPQLDPEDPSMISQGPSICLFNKADRQEVLASWLFMQYLLSDEVQISYSQTEGYVPVTLKAQNSDAYREYLSLGGSDGQLHYDVKIKATRLLIDNIENTFTTPVFNGSASLREAAGLMIENTAKAVKRKTVIDDEYFETLFSDTNALYRLDQQTSTGSRKSELGPLPPAAETLLITLGAVWVILGAIWAAGKIKKKKQ